MITQSRLFEDQNSIIMIYSRNLHKLTVILTSKNKPRHLKIGYLMLWKLHF